MMGTYIEVWKLLRTAGRIRRADTLRAAKVWVLCGEGTGVSAISAALSALQLSVLPNLESSRQSPSMFHLSATQAKSGDMCASRPILDVSTGIRLQKSLL